MPKTYWHLQDKARIPGDYEIATSKLLYYRTHGFEVNSPTTAWFVRYQDGSPFVCEDWEAFEDPRRTTYGSYVALQRERETFVDGLLAADSGPLGDEWLDFFGRWVAPLRYPCHGLQMLAGYAGHLAPSGRIVAALGFQAADEMRRVHRLAYRLAQLRRQRPTLGDDARQSWEDAPAWQPLRELMEQLLVAWDWGESFCVTNLVLKPWFDALFSGRLADLARAHDDDVLSRLLGSLREDGHWHRDWSLALVHTATESAPESRDVLAGWIGTWTPRVERAVTSFDELGNAETFDAIRASHRKMLEEARLA